MIEVKVRVDENTLTITGEGTVKQAPNSALRIHGFEPKAAALELSARVMNAAREWQPSSTRVLFPEKILCDLWWDGYDQLPSSSRKEFTYLATQSHLACLAKLTVNGQPDHSGHVAEASITLGRFGWISLITTFGAIYLILQYSLGDQFATPITRGSVWWVLLLALATIVVASTLVVTLQALMWAMIMRSRFSVEDMSIALKHSRLGLPKPVYQWLINKIDTGLKQ